MVVFIGSLLDIESYISEAGCGNRSFRYTPLVLERGKLPESHSKEVKREKLRGKKDGAEEDAASRVSPGSRAVESVSHGRCGLIDCLGQQGRCGSQKEHSHPRREFVHDYLADFLAHQNKTPCVRQM